MSLIRSLFLGALVLGSACSCSSASSAPEDPRVEPASAATTLESVDEALLIDPDNGGGKGTCKRVCDRSCVAACKASGGSAAECQADCCDEVCR